MNVAGILLAAGQSRRFGGQAKLLVDFGGEPLVRRIASRACTSRLREVLVVVGHGSAAVTSALEGLPLGFVPNPRYREGLSRSVAAGIASLETGVAAALFLTADQPFLSTAVINRILSRHASTGAAIVVPTHAGRRGSPVLFARTLFDRLAALEGDRGGREIVQSCPELVETVELDSARPLEDIDTPADYERLLGYTRDLPRVEGGKGEESEW